MTTAADQVSQRLGEEIYDTQEKKTRVRKAFFYIWTSVGACVLVGVLIYLLRVLAMPVSIILWTLVFVFCLRGIVNGLEKKGVNRALGTAIAYLAMFAVLAGIAFLMFSPMFGLNNQFSDLIKSIPMYMDQISAWAQGLYASYSDWFDNESIRNALTSVSNAISAWATSMASDAANAAIGVGSTIVNMFAAIGFAMVIAFWILMQLPAIGREAKRIISPNRYDDANFLHVTFTSIMGGYIKGTLLQCFIIGVACGILFAICGVPNAPALGVITGVLNIIPIVGPWLGGAAAAIMAVFVSPITAIIVLLGTIGIQQIVYTFISPKIMSNSVDIHPALTLIAMIFGSAIGGAMSGVTGSIVGMLFAIPAVAVIKACFVYYFEKHTQRCIVSEDGVFFKGNPSSCASPDPFSDATSSAAKEVRKKLAQEDRLHNAEMVKKEQSKKLKELAEENNK